MYKFLLEGKGTVAFTIWTFSPYGHFVPFPNQCERLKHAFVGAKPAGVHALAGGVDAVAAAVAADGELGVLGTKV